MPALLPGHTLLPYHVLLDSDAGVLLLDTPVQQRPFWSQGSLALGCAWDVTPRNIEPLEVGACLDLARQHEHLLKSLPIGTALQVLMTILPARSIPAWEQLRQDCPHEELLVAQKDAIHTGLRHHDGDSLAQLRGVQTLVTLRVPLAGLDPSLGDRLQGILGLPGTSAQAVIATIRTILTQTLRDFATLGNTVEYALKAAGHTVARLNGPGLKQAIKLALAPDQEILDDGLTDEVPLKEQVLTRPMQQYEGGWVFDPDGEPVTSQMLSLHHAPPATFPGMLCATRTPDGVEPLALWQAWEGPITVAVNMASTDARREELGRKTKRFFAERNQQSTENQEIAKELKALESKAFTEDEELHWGRVHIALWGDGTLVPAGLTKVVNRASRLHLPLVQDRGALGSTLWLQTLPLAFDPAWPAELVLQRAQRLPLVHLANLMPLYGCYQGTATSTIALLNSRGEPACLDVFDHLTNPHVTIAGTTGAGKTYLLAHVINQVMALGASVLLLDPLSNYRPLCAAQGGTFLHLTYDNPPCFNPFFGTRTEDHQAFVTAFWAECAGGGQQRLDVEKFNVLGSAVTYYMTGWDPSRAGEPTLTPFAREVLEDGCFARNDAIARRLGKQLARMLLMYYDKRPYARFVDGINTFTLNPGLTLIEFSEFEQAPALQGILFFALAHLAQQFFRDPSRFYMPKYFLADEVWKWILHEQTAAMLDKIIRTYRNFRTSAWFVSQRMEDYNTPTGKIILDLAGTKWLLKHDSRQFETVKDLFKLSDADMHLVSRAGKHADWSSGFLRMDEGEGGLVRIVSDRFTRLLMSQRTDIARRREQLTAQYDGKIRQAVAHMMSEGMAA